MGINKSIYDAFLLIMTNLRSTDVASPRLCLCGGIGYKASTRKSKTEALRAARNRKTTETETKGPARVKSDTLVRHTRGLK